MAGAELRLLANKMQSRVPRKRRQCRLYLGGAVIFATRWPECNSPGRFCLVGNSHHIWHIAVLAASVMTYVSCVNQHAWRAEHLDCPAL